MKHIKTKIIAHRGYSQKYPENTLISFKKAKELNADGIELDVHMTADKKLVIHHDYYLKDLGGKRILICNESFKRIRKINVGGVIDGVYKKEKIPTLEEVFDSIGKDIHYEIELKGFSRDFINHVIKLVKKYELFDNIEFTSPHLPVLFQLKNLVPLVKTGLFVVPFPSWMDKELGYALLLSNLELGRFNVAHLPLDMIEPRLVDLLHGKSTFVHAADCNTNEELKKAYILDVDQLSTNNLETALKLRYELNRG